MRRPRPHRRGASCLLLASLFAGTHPSASAQAPGFASPDGMRWVEGRVVDPPPAVWPKVAVAAAGATVAGVIALRGDGSPATTVSGLPSTSPSEATTATTTTTTVPTASCGYRMSGRSTPGVFPSSGGEGTCSVITTSECSWTARTNAGWVGLSSETGRGEGTVALRVEANGGDARMARVVLREDAGATCEVRQDAGVPPSPPPRITLTWSSELDVPGGSGQVVLDGVAAVYQLRGRAQGSRAVRGEARLEALLVAADGRPGTWRFEMGGSFRPGSVRIVAGEGVLQGPHAVVFRLRGRSGERVVFAVQAAP